MIEVVLGETMPGQAEKSKCSPIPHQTNTDGVLCLRHEIIPPKQLRSLQHFSISCRQLRHSLELVRTASEDRALDTTYGTLVRELAVAEVSADRFDRAR